MMNSDLSSSSPPSFWSQLTPVQRWVSGLVLAMVAFSWWSMGHSAVVHPQHQQLVDALLASQEVHTPEAMSSIQLWHIPHWEHLLEHPLYMMLASAIHAIGGVGTNVMTFISRLQWLSVLGVFATGWGLLRLMGVSGRFPEEAYQGWHRLMVLGCFFLGGTTLSSFVFPSPLPLFWACSIWTLYGLWRMDEEGWHASPLWTWSAIGAWACALLHPLGYTLVLAHLTGSVQQDWQTHHRQAYQWYLGVVLVGMTWLLAHAQGWHMPWQTPFSSLPSSAELVASSSSPQSPLTQWLMQGKAWLVTGVTSGEGETVSLLNLKAWFPKGFLKHSVHYLGQICLGYQPSVLHGMQASFTPPQHHLMSLQTHLPAMVVSNAPVTGVLGWMVGAMTPFLNGTMAALPKLAKTFGWVSLTCMSLGTLLGLYMSTTQVRRALWIGALIGLGLTLYPQVWLWFFPLIGFYSVLGLEGLMRIFHHAQAPVFRVVLIGWALALGGLGLSQAGFHQLQHQEAAQLFYGGATQATHTEGITALATQETPTEGFSFSALDLSTLNPRETSAGVTSSPVVSQERKGFFMLFDWMRRHTHPYSVFISHTPSMLSLYGNRYAISYPPQRTPAFLVDALLAQSKTLQETHREATLYLVEPLGDPTHSQLVRQALALQPNAFHLTWESPELQMRVWQVH
ncbi:MAG: hypothetical protein ACKO37_03655 [Vampirovibrionales bacterium]